MGDNRLDQQYAEHVQTTTNKVADYLKNDGAEAPIKLEAAIPPPPANPNLPGDADADLKGPGNARTNEEIDAMLAQQAKEATQQPATATKTPWGFHEPGVVAGEAVEAGLGKAVDTLSDPRNAWMGLGPLSVVGKWVMGGKELKVIYKGTQAAVTTAKGNVTKAIEQWDVQDAIPGITQNSTVSRETLEKAGATFEPAPPAPTTGGGAGQPPIKPPTTGGVPAVAPEPFRQRRDPRIDTLFDSAAHDAEGFAAKVETQRRGTLSDEAVIQLSNKSDLTTEAVLGLPPGTSLPVEDFHKVRTILKDTHSAMVKSAKAAMDEGTFEAYQLMFNDVATTRNVLTKIIGLYAEPSRTTRLMHQALPKAGATPSEAQGFTIADPFINQLYEFFAKTEKAAEGVSRTPKLAGSKAGAEAVPQELKDFTQAIAGLPSEDELASFMRPLRNPVFWDVWREQWYNGMLLGLAPVKNLVGTPTILAANIAERGVAAGIDSIGTGMVNMITGSDFKRSVYFGEVGAMLNPVANLEAFASGARLAWHTFKTGKQEFNPSALEHTIPAVSDTALWLHTTGPMGFATSWMSTAARRWTTKGIDLASTVGGRMLLAGDAATKFIGYSAELRALALREAYKTIEQEGLTGVEAVQRSQAIKRDILANPDRYPELVEQAKTFSRYVALQEDLGTAATTVNKLADTLTIGPREAGFPSGFPVGRWAMPFTSIYANMTKAIGERTGPFSLLSPAVQDELKAGGARQLTQMAKIGFSTVMLDTMYHLAKEGLITGNGPRDPAAKQHWQEATGKIPNAWWDPVNKVYRDSTAFQPFSTLTSAVADMVELMSYTPPDKVDELTQGFQALALAVMGNVGIKQWTQGIVGTVSTLTSGDYDTYQEWFTRSVVKAALPYSGALNQITAGIDPQTRIAIGTIDKLKQTIPGLSDTLPPDKNAIGRVLYRRGGWWNAFSHGLESEDPDIWQAAKAHNIVLTKPSKQIDGVPLTTEQYDLYLTLATDGLPESLQRWAEHSDTQTDEAAQRQVSQILENHHKVGKQKFLREAEDLKATLDADKTQRREGGPPKHDRFAPGKLTQPSITP